MPAEKNNRLNEVCYVRYIKNFFKQNSQFRVYQCHMSKVHSVDWNVDGRKLASGSFDKTVVIHSLSQDKLNKDHTLKGHTASVDQLCWHPTHPYQLCTASLDKTVRIWDIRSSRPQATISTKGENINICWSPNGQTIAVGNKDDLITLIDTKTYRIKSEQSFKFEVNELSWNNDNDKFFLTSGSGHVHVLNWPEMKNQLTLNAHPATCICIEFDPTGQYFAVGSADASVSIWDAEEMACLRTISRLEWPARTISFSHDGRLIASASEDLIIDISSTETGEKVVDVCNQAPTFTVAFHPARYLLAYACDDKDYNRDAGTIKLYGLPSEPHGSG